MPQWVSGLALQIDREDRYHPVCRVRGYCGPFVNQTYYNSLAVWAGFGDCVECGCTVPVPRGERGMESLGRVIEAIIPPPSAGTE